MSETQSKTVTFEGLIERIQENNNQSVTSYLNKYGADKYCIKRFDVEIEKDGEQPKCVIDRIAIIPAEDFSLVMHLSFDELEKKKYQTFVMKTNVNVIKAQ
jgi:hypothetical protein